MPLQSKDTFVHFICVSSDDCTTLTTAEATTGFQHPAIQKALVFFQKYFQEQMKPFPKRLSSDRLHVGLGGGGASIGKKAS